MLNQTINKSPTNINFQREQYAVRMLRLQKNLLRQRFNSEHKQGVTYLLCGLPVETPEGV